MNNARGQENDVAIKEYTNLLKQRGNINIIHQVPSSPFTNVLELCAWVSLQAAIEKQYITQRCRVDIFANSVNTMWNNGNLDRCIWNIFSDQNSLISDQLYGNRGEGLIETNTRTKHANIKFNFDLNIKKS